VFEGENKIVPAIKTKKTDGVFKHFEANRYHEAVDVLCPYALPIYCTTKANSACISNSNLVFKSVDKKQEVQYVNNTDEETVFGNLKNYAMTCQIAGNLIDIEPEIFKVLLKAVSNLTSQEPKTGKYLKFHNVSATDTTSDKFVNLLEKEESMFKMIKDKNIELTAGVIYTVEFKETKNHESITLDKKHLLKLDGNKLLEVFQYKKDEIDVEEITKSLKESIGQFDEIVRDPVYDEKQFYWATILIPSLNNDDQYQSVRYDPKKKMWKTRILEVPIQDCIEMIEKQKDITKALLAEVNVNTQYWKVVEFKPFNQKIIIQTNNNNIKLFIKFEYDSDLSRFIFTPWSDKQKHFELYDLEQVKNFGQNIATLEKTCENWKAYDNNLCGIGKIFKNLPDTKAYKYINIKKNCCTKGNGKK
jgi:hypothetical protein